MQQDPSASHPYDAFDTCRTYACQNASIELEDDDDYPFLCDPLEFVFVIEQEAAYARRNPGTANHAPPDIFTDYQYDLWDTTDSHPNSLLHQWRGALMKDMLPEVCHPHSQKFTNICGIPFPSRTRNIIVPVASEMDSWNNYYFAENPNVKPYVAGLTCVPDVNFMETD